ncbi:TOM7 family-domain-containing protein [Mucidula mucida]|nr:TOM7 family-domain-containing protein [Mucidula mucida]
MASVSEDTKEIINKAVELGRVAVHWGWIPLIIYVGFTRSNPQPSLIKLISPLA